MTKRLADILARWVSERLKMAEIFGCLFVWQAGGRAGRAVGGGSVHVLGPELLRSVSIFNFQYARSGRYHTRGKEAAKSLDRRLLNGS